MSNELSVYAGLIFNKNGASVIANESVSVSITGSNMVKDTQEIGTTEETLELPSDMSSAGFLLIKNLDDTNYVDIGVTTGVYTVRIKAGEIALFRPTSTTIYAKADTAAVSIQKTFIED